jgi:hypothetical protein
MRAAVLLYSVPTQLPVVPGDGVHVAEWLPCQGARFTKIASFPLLSALVNQYLGYGLALHCGMLRRS